MQSSSVLCHNLLGNGGDECEKGREIKVGWCVDAFQIRWGIVQRGVCVFHMMSQPLTNNGKKKKNTKGCANSHCVMWTIQNKRAVRLLFFVENCLPKWGVGRCDMNNDCLHFSFITPWILISLSVIFPHAQTQECFSEARLKKTNKKKKKVARQAKWFLLREVSCYRNKEVK